MQQQQAERYQHRQQRQEKLEQILEAKRDVRCPRLETLANRFARYRRLKVTPARLRGLRQATFEVTLIADVALKFSVAADQEVENAVFQDILNPAHLHEV